ncbi:hypothetical protein FBUS_04622 [Fasciolopsis buskii]|uniref:Regulator of MON1-CCZ1 complex N-terminal domain-containing protein n=1 Tax=Fasciolopsis buskii TaxID=27845 RepID=A0A8E0S341_9TREM|nr:hypothetical protein FBUS_04622 [Fasciolopsis buski]
MPHFLSLSENPTIFEPIGTNCSAFFDNSRRQIFTLRSRGTMGVTVKSPDAGDVLNFRIDDRGDVLSIKFCPGNRILAIQRAQRSVDFLNFSPIGPEDQPGYSQSCRTKTGKLLGFLWLDSTDILFISTDHLEIHQVSPTKRSVRLIKHVSHSTQWFLWHDSARVLVTSSEESKNNFYLFHFRIPHTITKVCKFEVPSAPGTGSCSMEPDRCLLLAL